MRKSISCLALGVEEIEAVRFPPPSPEVRERRRGPDRGRRKPWIFSLIPPLSRALAIEIRSNFVVALNVTSRRRLSGMWCRISVVKLKLRGVLLSLNRS